MKVAAYQAPLLSGGSMEAIELIQKRVKWLESEGVTILCCPEAILGGLADYSPQPVDFAIDVQDIKNEEMQRSARRVSVGY
jgi:5-aminopentanamidase